MIHGAGVGHGNGQGIGRIGRGIFPKSEENPHHERHLVFLGAAMACGGFFDEFGRIFGDGQSSSCHGHQCSAAGRTHDDRGSRALYVDDFFDGGGFRTEFKNKFTQLLIDLMKAEFWRAGRGIGDRAVGQGHSLIASGIDHRIAGASDGGIDAENTHGRNVQGKSFFVHRSRSWMIDGEPLLGHTERMKQALFLAMALGVSSAFAQDGRFESSPNKPKEIMQKKPAAVAGEKIQPKATGLVVMMSEHGLQVFNPLAPAELGDGRKQVTQNIKNTGPASNPDEDKRPFGGIILVGLEF